MKMRLQIERIINTIKENVCMFFFSTRKFNILCYKIENGERWPDPD